MRPLTLVFTNRTPPSPNRVCTPPGLKLRAVIAAKVVASVLLVDAVEVHVLVAGGGAQNHAVRRPGRGEPGAWTLPSDHSV